MSNVEMETDKTTLFQCCRRYIKKSHAPIAIPVITFVSLLFLGNILINNPSMLDIEVQAIQQRLTKLDKDLEELRRGGNQTLALEQYRRKETIRKVCQKYGNPKGFQKIKSFIKDPKVGRISQQWPREVTHETNNLQYVLILQSETIYCFNHKAGSSTWMAAYSELVDDINFVRMTRKTQQYYK